jgi:hypothetical protein
MLDVSRGTPLRLSHRRKLAPAPAALGKGGVGRYPARLGGGGPRGRVAAFLSGISVNPDKH